MKDGPHKLQKLDASRSLLGIAAVIDLSLSQRSHSNAAVPSRSLTPDQGAKHRYAS